MVTAVYKDIRFIRRRMKREKNENAVLPFRCNGCSGPVLLAQFSAARSKPLLTEVHDC